MAINVAGGKVLRIGIVRDGRMVAERQVPFGETVTVGASPDATAVIGGVVIRRWPLLAPGPDGYSLSVPAGARAKIATGDRIVAISGDPTGASVGPIAVSVGDRGKIAVGDSTVLFQFVDAPRPASSTPRVDFRGRFVSEDDTVLLGSTGVFGSLAAVLVLGARLLIPAESDAYVAQTDDKWDRIFVHQPPVRHIDPAPAPAPVGQRIAKHQGVSEPSPRAPRESAPVPGAPPVGHRAPSLAIVALGQHGAGGPGKLAGYDPTALDAVRKTLAGGGPVTYEAPKGGPRSIGGAPGTATPEDLMDGLPRLAAAPQVFIDASPPPGPHGSEWVDVDVDQDRDDSDWGRIRSVVARNVPQLKYCYDAVIKTRPDLAGRLEIDWKITNGRVSGTEVADNATGDDAFARCVETRIAAWRFDGVHDTEVSWPFIFKTGH